MNWILSKLFGLDPSKLKDVPFDKLSLKFVGLPQGWWALIMIALVAAFVWLSFRTYRREGKNVSPRLKNFLACLRLAAILLALMMLFQPTLVIDQSKPLRSAVLVLLDNSLSMGIKDKLSDPKASEELARSLEVSPARLQQMSRMDIACAMLEHKNFKVLKELSKDYDLKLATFGDTYQEVPLGGGQPNTGAAPQPKDGSDREAFVPNLASFTAPTGQSTNIELGLRTVVGQVRGQPIRAVVAVTDGGQNAGDAVAAAKSLNQKGIEIITVGIGDPNPPKNIEVSNIVAPNVAFKEDPLVITVTVVQKGFAGRQVPISLFEGARTNEKGRQVLTKMMNLPKDGEPQTVVLRYKPETLGVMTYRVEIPVQPGELIAEDNIASTIVRVVDQKAQVLFVSGSPGKEYQYLKNFLVRDTTIQAQCWLQNASTGFNQEASDKVAALEKFPQDETELFKYDVIILLDPDPSQFPTQTNPPWAELLRRFVGEHGGGLVYIAGNIYTEDICADPSFKPLTDLLPVEVGRQGVDVSEQLRPIVDSFPLILSPQGWDNPMFKLENDEAANKKLWGGEGAQSDMPGIYWSHPVFSLKPGGIALAVHSNPNRRTRDGRPLPLVAMQYYGVGRCVYLGFNSTWRWRYVEEGKYFNQFWGQCIRYISQGRLLGGAKRLIVRTDKEEYTVGQQVEITVTARDKDFEHPWLMKNLPITIKPENGTPVNLSLEPDATKEGDYRGTYMPMKNGLLEISPAINLPELEGGKVANKVVTVTIPKLEYKDTQMSESLLKQVSGITHAKYLRPREFDDLAGLLKRPPVMLINEAMLDLWDAPLLLVLFCLLLFTEWIIRKLKNMA